MLNSFFLLRQYFGPLAIYAIDKMYLLSFTYKEKFRCFNSWMFQYWKQM